MHSHIILASFSASHFPPHLGIFSLLVQDCNQRIGSELHVPKSLGSMWTDGPLFCGPQMDRLPIHLIGRIALLDPCDPVHLHHGGASVEASVVVVVHLQ